MNLCNLKNNKKVTDIYQARASTFEMKNLQIELGII
jgi:hypothetical protein